jgi:hypothetical protein
MSLHEVWKRKSSQLFHECIEWPRSLFTSTGSQLEELAAKLNLGLRDEGIHPMSMGHVMDDETFRLVIIRRAYQALTQELDNPIEMNEHKLDQRSEWLDELAFACGIETEAHITLQTDNGDQTLIHAIKAALHPHLQPGRMVLTK